MAKEKINVLYTVDDKEFPSKDYMNALEKMKTLSKEYEELKRVEGKQDQREEKRSSGIFSRMTEKGVWAQEL